MSENCRMCGGTGWQRNPCGPGIIEERCPCSPVVTTPESERTEICGTCDGSGWEEVHSNGPGKASRTCSYCGGCGRV